MFISKRSTSHNGWVSFLLKKHRLKTGVQINSSLHIFQYLSRITHWMCSFSKADRAPHPHPHHHTGLAFSGVHKCIFMYVHCSQFTMFHFTLYSQDLNIECVWRDIKTIPRPQEFYRAPSSEMFDPPLPLLIHQHE